MKAVAIVVHYQPSLPANVSNLADEITGSQRPAYCLALGAFYHYTSKFDWLMTDVSQIYYPMGGGSFSGRLAILLVLALLVHVAVMHYSAELSLTKKTFLFLELYCNILKRIWN